MWDWPEEGELGLRLSFLAEVLSPVCCLHTNGNFCVQISQVMKALPDSDISALQGSAM